MASWYLTKLTTGRLTGLDRCSETKSRAVYWTGNVAMQPLVSVYEKDFGALRRGNHWPLSLYICLLSVPAQIHFTFEPLSLSIFNFRISLSCPIICVLPVYNRDRSLEEMPVWQSSQKRGHPSDLI
jgi:hypothetical protein